MPTLTATPRALSAARLDARALCHRHHVEAGRADDFVLVVSELVGNALQHGRAPSRYDVSLDAGDLLVTVDDARPEGPGRPASAATDAERGRGLALVEALARLWGWLPTASGKRVWARV